MGKIRKRSIIYRPSVPILVFWESFAILIASKLPFTADGIGSTPDVELPIAVATTHTTENIRKRAGVAPGVTAG